MDERGTGQVAEAVWRALEAGDWDTAAGLLHEDFVQEWPQSGERIVGRDNAIAINQNFPGGLPTMRFRRTLADADLAVLELELTYADGSRYLGELLRHHRPAGAGVDTGSPQFRNAVAPLNQPSADLTPQVHAAATQASTAAFHLAMLVAAGLLMAGAAVNGLGIRNPAPAGRHLGPGAEQPPPGSGSGTPSGPIQVAPQEYTNQQPQADPTDYLRASRVWPWPYRGAWRGGTA
jgi:SnoaL-like domain